MQHIFTTSASKPPTLDDILDIWMQTPLKENAPPDSLHDEVKALEEVYESLRAAGSTADAWCEFFQKESAPNLPNFQKYKVAGYNSELSLSQTVKLTARNRPLHCAKTA